MRPRILIVDDETNVRLNYRVTLETEGYEIVEAASAARALHQLIEQFFSLAILDMRLPGMDGLALLARMREIGITVPVMIVTAYSDVPHAVRAMKLGAIDFHQKPLRPEDLRRIVTEILERHAPRKEHQIDDFHSHIVAAKRCLNLRSFESARLHLVQAMELNTKSVEAFNLAAFCAK
jgi:DNA-binding NtrC family response regulator